MPTQHQPNAAIKLTAAALFVLLAAFFSGCTFITDPELSRSECLSNVRMLFRGAEIKPLAGSLYTYYVFSSNGYVYQAGCPSLFNNTVTFSRLLLNEGEKP